MKWYNSNNLTWGSFKSTIIHCDINVDEIFWRVVLLINVKPFPQLRNYGKELQNSPLYYSFFIGQWSVMIEVMKIMRCNGKSEKQVPPATASLFILKTLMLMNRVIKIKSTNTLSFPSVRPTLHSLSSNIISTPVNLLCWMATIFLEISTVLSWYIVQMYTIRSQIAYNNTKICISMYVNGGRMRVA